MLSLCAPRAVMDQLFGSDNYAGAAFDETRTYRYILWRKRKLGGQYCSFIMLNPSTADEEKLDPTCAKCATWARSWGFDGFYVVNAFALRSTDPGALKTAVKVGQNPIGIDNDAAILKVVKDSRLIVVGWGRHATLLNRDQQMRDLLRNFHLYCVGINGDGSPEHPLYVRKAILPRPWPIHPER
jgi:hypothetical protein